MTDRDYENTYWGWRRTDNRNLSGSGLRSRTDRFSGFGGIYHGKKTSHEGGKLLLSKGSSVSPDSPSRLPRKSSFFRSGTSRFEGHGSYAYDIRHLGGAVPCTNQRRGRTRTKRRIRKEVKRSRSHSPVTVSNRRYVRHLYDEGQEVKQIVRSLSPPGKGRRSRIRDDRASARSRRYIQMTSPEKAVARKLWARKLRRGHSPDSSPGSAMRVPTWGRMSSPEYRKPKERNRHRSGRVSKGSSAAAERLRQSTEKVRLMRSMRFARKHKH